MSTIHANGHPNMEISQSEFVSVYQLLGQTYLNPPTEELCQQFKNWHKNVEEEQLSNWDTLKKTADGDPNKLAAEYTRLIQGYHQNRSPQPPHESVYRDGRLQGPASVAVEQLYAQAGLSYDGPPEKIDHLGMELQFMSHLCKTKKEALQRKFLDNHLIEWVPSFHERAEAYDPPQFYSGVFELTEELLGIHQEHLGKS